MQDTAGVVVRGKERHTFSLSAEEGDSIDYMCAWCDGGDAWMCTYYYYTIIAGSHAWWPRVKIGESLVTKFPPNTLPSPLSPLTTCCVVKKSNPSLDYLYSIHFK